MNDTDIKKALECHTKEDVVCTGCPLYPDNDCVHILTKSALDLINRQQEEIDQWKEEANRYQNLYCMSLDDIGKAKSEAVKQFAEMLKKHIFCMEYRAETKRKTVSIEKVKELIAWILTKVVIDTVDKTVKEMVGDTE